VPYARFEGRVGDEVTALATTEGDEFYVSMVFHQRH
jgi:hypothetical protein